VDEGAQCDRTKAWSVPTCGVAEGVEPCALSCRISLGEGGATEARIG
jgi:hypothetical protein